MKEHAPGNGKGEAAAGKPRVPGREPLAKPLPKRFYKAATHRAADGQGFVIELDGKPVRTPGKRLLLLPPIALAEAVAAEWAAQRERIDPATMPLTRLVNSAIDGVATRMEEVSADIVDFAGSDLTCYRAEAPQELVQRQHERSYRLLYLVPARRLSSRSRRCRTLEHHCDGYARSLCTTYHCQRSNCCY